MNKDIDESLKYLFEEYKRLKLKAKKQKLTIEENETLKKELARAKEDHQYDNLVHKKELEDFNKK